MLKNMKILIVNPNKNQVLTFQARTVIF